MAIIAALVVPATAPSRAAAEAPLSYPYLDGSESGFPAYRAVAARMARGYVMVTLVARPDPVNGSGGGDLHTGSGIVIDREGRILTAAHIARGPEFSIRVQLWNGRVLRGEVVKVAPRQELALIRTGPLPEAEPIPFADDPPPKKGDPALAIGSPRRMWGVVSVGRVRSGDIGERLDYGNWGFDNAVEIGMEVESGHSGGPVVDARGRIIGMVAGYELGDTTKPGYVSPRITYAVPVRAIKAWIAR